MRTYHVKLKGKTPQIHHADNVSWSDEMDAWKNDPENKKGSKAGDDRSPAWRWLGHLYHDGSVIAVPSDNLMTALREGGTMVPVPGGKSGKTFKSQTQSGMLVDGTHWPLLVGKEAQSVSIGPVLALRTEKSFDAHKKKVESLKFSLLVKRARIGQKKHVRVRPIFETWATEGLIRVWDEQITSDALKQIVTYAGLYKGIGDWRPGGKTPGPYGMFTAEVREQ